VDADAGGDRDAGMTTVETYGLALLTEECGEVLQLIGKAGRFGLDTPGVKDPLTGVVDMTVTPRTKLVEELGDLLAAVEYLSRRGVVDGFEVGRRYSVKLHRLLDPESRDNLGRRLAP
jgi:NTP pyrophosphatase (non-canonical NTP hydrolase)